MAHKEHIFIFLGVYLCSSGDYKKAGIITEYADQFKLVNKGSISIPLPIFSSCFGWLVFWKN